MHSSPSPLPRIRVSNTIREFSRPPSIEQAPLGLTSEVQAATTIVDLVEHLVKVKAWVLERRKVETKSITCKPIHRLVLLGLSRINIKIVQ